MTRRTSPPSAATFSVEPTATTEESLAALWDHLEAKDSELAALLRTHLTKLDPLPPPGQARTNARRQFNEAVAVALDSSLEPEPDE